MSYNTMAMMAADTPLYQRIIACAATQEIHPPEAWVGENRWRLAASPGWDAAYAYAINANRENPDYEPGRDEAVITDGMILAAVQKLLAKGAPNGA